MPSLPCSDCGAPRRDGAGLGRCAPCALRAALDIAPEAVDPGAGEEPSLRRTGDYDLLDEIARGGMGVVYRARQRSLDRTVALKVLLGGAFAGAEGRRRLRAEAAAAARLQHPGIVAVHDTGELDGQPFYAMEFVAGRTLADLARDGPLPAKRAAHYAAKLAEAVAYAHRQGVVHRDLKPSNVLVDAQDQPRITDFGLAKEMAGDAQHTLTGTVAGSPGYMSPEQAAGRSREVGPASDVYSLGALLYELLAGRAPFLGENAHAVLEQVRHLDPVPLRRLSAGVPLDLETICLKCLEKEPTRRYPSAEALAADLHRYLADEPVQARPVGAWGRAWRWARRHPLPAALGVAAALLALTLIAVLGLGAERIRESRNEARARLRESLGSEAHALRLAAEPGWREKCLRTLTEASRLDPDAGQLLTLRQEALAALARPDLIRHPITNLPPTTDPMVVCFDRTFERLALWNRSRGEVAIHDVADGRELVAWKTSQPDEIRAFGADGRHVLLRHGGALSVWETTQGVRVISGEESQTHQRFNSGAFSPDGSHFGRGETGGTFAVYDLRQRPPARVQAWLPPSPAGREPVATVAWSADGAAVALTLGDSVLAVCDAAGGRVRWQREYGTDIWNVAWNNARDRIAVQADRGRVLLLDARNGEELHQLNFATDGSSSCAFSPDGSRLALSRLGLGTQWMETEGGRSLMRDRADAWHLHFDGSGRKLGSLLDEGIPLWLEWSPPLVLTTLQSPGATALSQRLAFSPDGRWLVTASSEAILFWDAASLQLAAQVPLVRPVLGEFDRTGRRLLCASGKRLFEIALPTADHGGFGSPVALIEGEALGRACISSRDAVAVPDAGRDVVHLLLGTNRTELAVAGYPGRPAFSPDGRWLACPALVAARLLIFDLDHPGAAPVRLPEPATTPLFTPDGEWLLTFDREAHMRRVGSWQPGPRLPLASVSVDHLLARLSRDGRWLAATQRNREVHLIDLRVRETVAVLDGPDEGKLFDLEFHPDGDTLVVARDRGMLQFWNLRLMRQELAKLGLDW